MTEEPTQELDFLFIPFPNIKLSPWLYLTAKDKIINKFYAIADQRAKFLVKHGLASKSMVVQYSIPIVLDTEI